MGVSGEKVRLVGQFEILAQDNFFSSKVRLVGQFILRSCPTGRTPVYKSFYNLKEQVKFAYLTKFDALLDIFKFLKMLWNI